MVAFKAVAPGKERDAGGYRSSRLASPPTSGLPPSETKSGAVASTLPVPPGCAAHVFSLAAPRFENRMRRMAGMKTRAMKAAVPPVNFHALNDSSGSAFRWTVSGYLAGGSVCRRAATFVGRRRRSSANKSNTHGSASGGAIRRFTRSSGSQTGAVATGHHRRGECWRRCMNSVLGVTLF